MEQFRAILEKVKKYHFWILCGLIVLITFGSWYMATSDRVSYYDGRKKKIESEFGGVQKIGAMRDHPSTPYISALKDRERFDPNAPEEVRKLSGIDKPEQTLAYNVANANNRLFEEQAGLKLPIVYPDSPGDQQRFEEQFRTIWNHKIEDIEKQTAALVLDVNYRIRYRDRIKDFFPRLFDMIDRRREIKDNDAPAANQRFGAAGLGGHGVDDRAKHYEGIVDWADADNIMDRFEKWNDTPTTLQVMLAQEDLWVYEAVLKVIRNTNDFGNDPKHDPANYKPPPSHKLARIKEILALEIGNEAVQSWTSSENSVVVLPTEASGPATAAAQPMAPQPMSADRGKAGYLERNLSGGSTVSPLIGRYVDNSGKPLTDPTQQPNDEFRMMPIDMKLVIEQNDIPRLLVECANSSMRIDVRSVRILVDKPPPFSEGGGGPALMPGGMGPSMEPMSRGFPGMRGGAMGGRAASSGSGAGDSEDSADAIYAPVPVEIQGIIYIYNPPEAQAGPDNGGQAIPASGAISPTGTPPASTPPAAAPPAATAPGGISPAGTPKPATGAPAVSPPGAAPPATIPANPLGPALAIPGGAAPAAPAPAPSKPTR